MNHLGSNLTPHTCSLWDVCRIFPGGGNLSALPTLGFNESHSKPSILPTM